MQLSIPFEKETSADAVVQLVLQIRPCARARLSAPPICCLPSAAGKQDKRACGLVAGSGQSKASRPPSTGRGRGRRRRRRELVDASMMPITCDASGSASAFASACGRPPAGVRAGAGERWIFFVYFFLLSAGRLWNHGLIGRLLLGEF